MKKILISSVLLHSLHLLANAQDFIYHGHEETLHLIKGIITRQEKGVYLRIGDGDASLAAGLTSGTHKAGPMIQREEQEVLGMEGKNIIKTLPLDRHVYQKTNTTYDGHHSVENLKLMIEQANQWWGTDRNVYSPHVLGHYAITDIPKCVQFLKFLKQTNPPLLIGNEKIPSDIRHLLFGQQCDFIASPARNAYTDIDRIEQETLKKLQTLDPHTYHVIMLSLGNTGRVLVKRIYDKVGDNFFFFDFGSLMDAVCGFKSRIWIRTYFNYDLFLAELHRSLKDS